VNALHQDTSTYLVESLGPTDIVDTCFVNNQVISSGVAVYGNTLSSSGVHSTSSGGSLCAFASVFETRQQYATRTPLCVSSSRASCDLLSSGPTAAPVLPIRQYVPFTINALDYDEASESDAVLEGGCNREGTLPLSGPDAQNTDDGVCKQHGGCHVSHTKPGEFLVYKFGHAKQYEANGVVMVDVTVRMASLTRKEFKLEVLYDGKVEQQASLFTDARGYRSYTDIAWRGVPLRADKTTHAIRVNFVTDNINFCAVGIKYSSGGPFPATSVPTLPPSSLRPSPTRAPTTSPTGPTLAHVVVVPGQYNAMSFTNDYLDQDRTREGSCPYRTDTPVDAKITQDSICRQAISEFDQHCNIGWTAPNEYVVYAFRKQSSKTSAKVTVRVSSLTIRDVQVDLYNGGGALIATKQFETAGRGSWDTYDTVVVWNSITIGTGTSYKMKITFLEGGVNMCSFGIE
jgi:hypothetical protein